MLIFIPFVRRSV